MTPLPTLYFDTETTGLVPMKGPISQGRSPDFPYLVQLAFLFTYKSVRIEGNMIVSPAHGIEIPEVAANIHGITTERARDEGIPCNMALTRIYPLFRDADVVVGHNLEFDMRLLEMEFLRTGFALDKRQKKYTCTMKETTSLCRLPGKYGFKWPKLQELHQFLFGEEFEDAHDAFADIRATERCYLELVKRGLFLR